jgi:hypothetical protein
LAEQDPQNRSYPRPRKARKRYKKKRPKPSPPSPPLMGVLYAQIKETQQLADHPPTHPHPSPWRNTKRGVTRDHLQHRRKLSVPSLQSPIHPPYPLTMERASTTGKHNKDVPRPTPTTHGHQLSRKLVRRLRPPSVLSLTQPTTTRTASIVQRHQIQHLPTPTWGHPLRRVSTQLKHAI